MAGMTQQQRDVIFQEINDGLPTCDRGKRLVIEKLAREILDDIQLVHLVELISEVKQDWK
jgi:hypothetical protein